MNAPETKSLRKQAFEANKLLKRLRRQVGQAIADYDMIRGGDRVMVCLSGGKDSYGLLDVLMKLREHAPLDFEIVAVNLDQRHPGFPEHVLPDYLSALGIPFRVVVAGHLQRRQARHPGGQDDVLALLAPAPRRALSRGAGGRRHTHRAWPSSRRHSRDVLPESLLRRQAEGDAAQARVRRRSPCGHPSARLCEGERPRSARAGARISRSSRAISAARRRRCNASR